jgi:hypothetical protein
VAQSVNQLGIRFYTPNGLLESLYQFCWSDEASWGDFALDLCPLVDHAEATDVSVTGPCRVACLQHGVTCSGDDLWCELPSVDVSQVT